MKNLPFESMILIFRVYGLNIFNALEVKSAELREIFPSLQIRKSVDYKRGQPTIYINKEIDVTDPATANEQTTWLAENLNKWVNLFRPLIVQEILL